MNNHPSSRGADKDRKPVNLPRQARVMRALVRWRWWLVGFSILSLVGFEIFEHILVYQELNLAFIIESIVYGVTFPLLLGLILSLYHVRTQLSEAVYKAGNKHWIEDRLAKARDWDELVTTLLQIPRTLLPLRGSRLIIFDPQEDDFKLEGEWYRENFQPSGSALPNQLSAEPLHQGDRWIISTIENPCKCHLTADQTVFPALCMPLHFGDAFIGLFQLYLEPETKLDEENILLFEQLAPIMSLAIEGRQGYNQVQFTAQLVEGERRRIARYLHDSLVPNLAFIRLMVDQIQNEELNRGDPLSDPNLQNLVKVTDDSYEIARTFLSNLYPHERMGLTEAIQEAVQVFKTRVDFSIELNQTGDTSSLDAPIIRKVILVVREALRNVEKYAAAQHVSITLDWGEEKVYLCISDDGGGFDPKKAGTQENRYGLRMIRECAAELDGGSEIKSGPNQGTEIRFWFPVQRR